MRERQAGGGLDGCLHVSSFPGDAGRSDAIHDLLTLACGPQLRFGDTCQATLGVPSGSFFQSSQAGGAGSAGSQWPGLSAMAQDPGGRVGEPRPVRGEQCSCQLLEPGLWGGPSWCPSLDCGSGFQELLVKLVRCSTHWKESAGRPGGLWLGEQVGAQKRVDMEACRAQ